MQYAVDIALCLIFFITVAVSVKKGFFYSLFELVGYLVSVLLAKGFSSKLSPIVFESVLKEPASKKIASVLGDAGTVNYKDAVEEIFDKIPTWAEGIVKSLGIDEKAITESLASSDLSGNNAVETIMNKIVSPIGISVVQIILFALSVIAFMFVLKVVVRLLNKIIKKLPVFKGLNSVLGGVLGAAKGAVLVIIAAVLVIALSGLFGSEKFVDAVSDSFIVSSIKGILTQVSGFTA